MLLRDISLYLNVLEFDREYRSEFGFQTRYICNFVRRRIAVAKFRTEGFGSVAVQGCLVSTDDCRIEGENVLVGPVAFDREAFDSLARDERPEFAINMLLGGLRKCAQSYELPLSTIEETIEEFRRGGYRNEWTHSRKTFRRLGLKATLKCAMDDSRFALTLEVGRRGTPVFNDVVLETRPDETIFAYRFKEVVVEEDALVVKNKFGRDTFSVPLHSLE